MWMEICYHFYKLPASGTGANLELPTKHFRCSLRVVLVRTRSCLPNIFKVLPERGTGAKLELSTEYFESATCAC
jgi:hypothetical protein